MPGSTYEPAKNLFRVLIGNFLIAAISFISTLLLAEVLINHLNPAYKIEKEKFMNETYSFRHMFIPKDVFSTSHKPFPIFGIALNLPGANNYGIMSKTDYPYIPTSQKKIIVGLFGGSVAEQQHPVLEYLILREEKIQKLVNEGFDIKILNFAVGSGRQPQQFNIALHFIDHLDILVNLDGLNDVTMTAGQYYPADFPVLTSEYYFLDAERFALREKMYRSRLIHLYLLKPLNSKNIFSQSTVYFLFARTASNLLNNIYNETAAELRMNGNTKIINSNKYNISQASVDSWSKFTTLQNLAVSHYGKTQLFFIQPNPHLEETKVLSEEEKTYIQVDPINPDYWSRDQYKKLLVSATQLKTRGIAIFDMTKVFAGTSTTTYVDNCCHLNNPGKHILGTAMAPAIINSMLKVARLKTSSVK